MNNLRAIHVLTLAALLATPILRAQDDLLEKVEEAAEAVQIESLETTYDQDLGVARATGEVVIQYEDTTIFANEAEYHQNTGDIFAKDEVSIYKAGQVFRGDEAVYNINTGVIIASGLRSGLDPLFYETEEVTLPGPEPEEINTFNTYLTTHDAENPNYRIKAKRIDIYPDTHIVFKSATVYFGKVPVAYLPFLAQPLDDELGYFFTPGYNDAWGPFLLNQYGFMIGEHTLATAQLDYRSQRGVGGGIELESMRHKQKEHFGKIYFYYANDDDPNLNPSGEIRNTDLGSGRYRFNVQHRVYVPGPEKSSLYLDVDINKLSDELFYLDFFPGEFREDPRPDNLVNLVKNHPRGTLSVLGRFQLNDFFHTDTRLPEVALDAVRQKIGNTPLFYEGTSSWAKLEEKISTGERQFARERTRVAEERLQLLADTEAALEAGEITEDDVPVFLDRIDPVEEADFIDRLTRQLDENSFNRLYTYHQLSLPAQLGNWLTLVPRAGYGYVNYEDVTGNLSEIGSVDRTFYHAGMDISTKFTKRYDGAISDRLGLDKVMHVFQPYSRYSYVGADEIGDDFPGIDRLTLSTKHRPLDITRFTATDSITDWNIFRVGAYNRLITRRNDANYEWLSLNTFVEFYGEDPEFDRDYSNLYNELRWVPLPWLLAQVDSQIPIGGGMDFTEVNTYLTFQPLQNFRFSVGHFWLDDHPFFIDSNNVRLSTYTRLNDNWGFSTNHFYEFRDGTLELQQYSIHRDLSSFTLALGAQIRDNRVAEELGLVFSMTMKAFPRIGMPIGFYGGANGGIRR